MVPRKDYYLLCANDEEGIGWSYGENLYGCSFRLYRQDMTLKCAAFYRIQDGFLAEYIGIEPADQNEHVLERVRYLAARIDNAYPAEEVQNDRQELSMSSPTFPISC